MGPAYVFWAVFAFCCFLALPYAAWVAWETVPRIKAGPIRFRLQLASLRKPSKPQQGITSAAFAFSFVSVLVVLVWAGSPSNHSPLVGFLILCLWAVTNCLGGTARRWFNPQRDAKPWRVLAAGLLALVMGAVALVFGFRAIQAGENSAGPFVLLSVIGFAMSAALVREYMSGTLVRERGIEILGSFLPWSRIVVKQWQPREGGFGLLLAVRSPRRLGILVTPEGEVTIPVPASERPALEAFLAGHTAITP